MDNNLELNRELLSDAIKLGLCKQWQNEWREDETLEALYKKMADGIRFCMENDYPNKSLIKSYFPEEFRVSHNVFVDTKHSVSDGNLIIALGDSEITSRTSFIGNTEIYASNNSKVKAIVRNKGMLSIHLYQNATADIKNDIGSRVCVFIHDEGVSYTASDTSSVIVRNRIGKRYNYQK